MYRLCRLQKNSPANFGDATGVELAAIAHHHAGDADAPCLGGYLTQIRNVALGTSNLNSHTRCGGINQSHRLARSQNCLAARRGDDALVTYRIANEVDAVASRSRYSSLIDHAAANHVALKVEPIGEKILIGYSQGAGNKTRRIHTAGGTDQYACRVDQPDLAIGTQRAVNQRRIAAQHTIEYAARSRSLNESRCLAGRDVELIPLQNCAVTIGDRRHATALTKAGSAANDLHAGRSSQCKWRPSNACRSHSDYD